MFDSELLKQSAILAGPTGGGKSNVAMAWAERTGAEIVALDSMTIYRGMDIGTAKPTLAEQARVPHHLLDVVAPHEEYSVAQYLQAAETACAEIVSRGRLPLFVGGTGLYLRSLLRGVFEGPPADWELRKRLEARLEQDGPGSLHTDLQRVDPPTAARLHPHDTRRIIRALEVFETTGHRMSDVQQQDPRPVEERPLFVVWLERRREQLYERIDQRVDAMLAAGWVEEARVLATLEPPIGRTARQALGYREIFEHFQGLRDWDHTVPLIKQRTRQFAKRQHTWFRNLEECTALPVADDEPASAIMARLDAMLTSQTK